jgi:CubicO group peptidase (beta-lactamase class C family)
MRKHLCLTILTSLAMLTHAQPAPHASKPATHSKLETAVDNYLRPYVETNNFTGTVLIAQKGQVLLQKGYGRANYELNISNTPETRFHIASVSKPFTSAAILLLQEKGLLKTSDTLAKFVPDYPNGDKITLRNLLTHTSGIPNVNDFPDYDEFAKSRHTVAELVAKFKDKPLEFQPGQKYRYSNSNYNLLAYIIEKVSGQSYGDFLKHNIFDPLAMSATGHDGDAAVLIPNRASGYNPTGATDLENAPFLDWSNKTGNGSLYSTAADLYKFDRALYSEQLLKKPSRDEMFEEAKGIHYGWSIGEQDGHKLTSINGRSPGFNATLLRFVDDDSTVIVLSNSYSSVSQTVVAPDLARILFGQSPQSPFRLQPLADKNVQNFLGRYQFGADYFRPNSAVTVEHAGKSLRMRWDSGLTSALLPVGENEFIERAFWGTVTFPQEQAPADHFVYNLLGTFTAKRAPQ